MGQARELTVSKVMESVGGGPVAEDVLAGEDERVVLVRLPVEGIGSRVPEATVARPLLARLGRPPIRRARVDLAPACPAWQLKRDRVGRIYVVMRRIPRARHVLPVVRDAVEIPRRLRFD